MAGDVDERAEIEAVLQENREAVAMLLDGLTEDEARARLVPSLTTPMGLVKHAAFAERVWFQVTLAGRSRAEVGVPETVDESFAVDASDTVAAVAADYRRAWAEGEELAAAYDLDHVVRHSRRGELTLRWVLLHMIRELARHAGHGDILREQLLAQRVTR